MVSRRRAKGILTALGLYILAAAMIGYFWFHAYTGQRGLHAQHEIEQQMTELTAELDRLKAERTQWDRKVSLLRSSSIDPDLLDERVRALLNLSHPNDLIMMAKPR